LARFPFQQKKKELDGRNKRGEFINMAETLVIGYLQRSTYKKAEPDHFTKRY
jgi:hypothetical protein